MYKTLTDEDRNVNSIQIKGLHSKHFLAFKYTVASVRLDW